MSSSTCRQLLLWTICLAATFLAGLTLGQARELKPVMTPLFSTSKTIMDEPINYPCGGPAKLTAAILSMAPGASTGWHTHGVPVAGYVLEGELTVSYKNKGERVYKTGEAIAEAIAVPHSGRNAGTQPMRLFALFMGAEGTENTIAASE